MSLENNPTCKLYWLKRGFTEDEAKIEIKKRRKSSKEYWINLGHDEIFSISKAKEYSNKANKYNIEYWLTRGFSKEESIINSNKEKEKCANRISNRSESVKRRSNKLCKEFWLKRGFSEEESILKINEEQHKKLDYKKSSEKAAKTRKANNSKLTKEEKSIKAKNSNGKTYEKFKNKTHSPIFIEYWLNLGYNIEDAKIKLQECKYYNSKSNNSSKIERKCLDELSQYLNINIEYGKYVTIDKNVFSPDGKYDNIIFEFNGSNIHLDDRFYDKLSINCYSRSYDTVKERDNFKLSCYHKKYTTIIIWEYDYKNDKEKLFKEIKNFLTQIKNYENKENRRSWDSSSL